MKYLYGPYDSHRKKVERESNHTQQAWSCLLFPNTTVPHLTLLRSKLRSTHNPSNSKRKLSLILQIIDPLATSSYVFHHNCYISSTILLSQNNALIKHHLHLKLVCLIKRTINPFYVITHNWWFTKITNII